MRLMFPMLAAAFLGADGLPLFNARVDADSTDPVKPRNKYGLTDEERELMASMSPKEKKLFLRNRGA